MRLKSIEMQGFKSFADKIFLDFNPGITAIVGPNGSGKSNISDAIRWVMGEQSIKSLRGSKMEDVIFSGTESRKPLGFAEVTLTLDNSDNYFSLDFPEISVTRRVYRSGEGEYYINKTQCRLKDVHELFMDTGLGRDGYSIIGQGKIDAILSSKSDDRRQIFEEAAGISKYKYRKLEAERKLEHTTENLSRAEDILGELESRIGPLERQSEKARKYLMLRDEMRELDINVSVINAEKTKAELSKLTEDMAIVAANADETRKSIETTEKNIADLYEGLNDYDEKIKSYREADKDSGNKINEKTNRLTICKSDIEHNEQNIKRLKEETTAFESEIKKLDIDTVAANNTLAELNAKNAGVSKSLEELSEEARKTGAESETKNEILENIKSDIINLNSEINSLEASNRSLVILSENFERRKAEIETEKTSGNDNITELETQKSQTEGQIGEYENKAEALKKDISAVQTAIKNLEIEEANLRDRRNKEIILLNQKQSRKSMLEDMEREYEGYTRGVKEVMTAYENNRIPKAIIHGPLSRLIATEQKYVTAIETALGAANQNIVTETEEDAKAAINYLKNHKSGRATFLPISAIKSKSYNFDSVRKRRGFVAVASELIKCDAKYKNIAESFLGGTVVCDTLDNAIETAKIGGHKFKIVTLDGDVIQAGGAMTGGSKNKTTGSLSRSGEILNLDAQISDLKINADKTVKTIEAITKDINQKKAELDKIGADAQNVTQELIRLNSSMRHYEEMLANASASSEQLEKELSSVACRIDDIAREKQNNSEKIQNKTAQVRKLEADVEDAGREYSKLSDMNGILGDKINELNITRNTILKDIELQNERIYKLNSEKAVRLESLSVKANDIKELEKKNTELSDEIISLKTEIEKLESSAEDYADMVIKLSAERSGAEKQIRSLQENVKSDQETLFGLTRRIGKMESQSARLNLEIENIVNRLLEEYELPYSEAAAIKPKENFDYNAASKTIKELKEKIKALGNINIDAIEEYKEIKERFDFLTAQTSDLKKARGELISVIDEMQEIMQTKFAKQFRIINESFNRVFCELFGGGRANLIMSDPSNILESGIEIEAQPPGKKLQSLTLLSGGERAFTAIALLFSILEVRPTPFCILDEIEAALDDVNVYRTADYLKRYSSGTQFIVVTHRRGTMEAANILYGVTMQERGISKLLSLNIDDIQG